MVELTIKKRHAIKKSQLASLMQKLTDTIGSDAALYNAPMIEIAETASKFNIYIIDKKPLIMEQDTWAFPTLRGAVLRPFSGHRIVVDMGAVPYMINGAVVLRPGIISVTDDVVVRNPALVVYESRDTPLGYVTARYNAAGIIARADGEAVIDIDSARDGVWTTYL